MSAESFHPGQRWVSETEPELGLGSILRVGPRTVTVVFGVSDETREYALDNAPLRRVRFRAGDTIRDQAGEAWKVDAVVVRAGLVYYQVGGGSKRAMPETELSDSVGAGEAEEKLRARRFDPPEFFDLRFQALGHQHRRRQSPVRGFTGGRIDLIPHQLYIAAEVTRRLCPRVLLADEVGLGKTIEACLIVHRLLLTGRASRVLVLVPESLVHQWFVELLRRFNLWFHIFDEERCVAIEGANPDSNPFLDDQIVLASLGLLSKNPRRLAQAVEAGWDLLVVDEAHHLGWSSSEAPVRSRRGNEADSADLEAVPPPYVGGYGSQEPSAEYQAVEALGRGAGGLLLLTATPEQLGIGSHFARLRLLDPARFFDLNEFIREAAGYREVAGLVEQLQTGAAFDQEDVQRLANVLGRPEAEIRAGLAPLATSPEGGATRAEWINTLLDQHGTGRVMFRNTRATIAGFPRRIAVLHVLAPQDPDGDVDEERFEALATEFAADVRPDDAAGFEPDYADDLRIDWLAGLLRSLEPAKVLLICRTRAKVEAIEAALRRRLTLKTAAFHEGLTLVKRDRNAAWFAEEDGARLLICSEIGSEGRNFQFAHHLVLFDLPLDPELLEQRLGRLDRIGQRSEIQVHVPYVSGSSQEVLARWFHEGLNSFEQNLQGGRELLEQFGPRVFDLAQDFHETEATARGDLERLIDETKAARLELTARLEAGRDRLLELNSHRPERARGLVQAIRQLDDDRNLDAFILAVLDHYGVRVEELTPRTYQLGSAGVFADSFPGLPPDGLTVTADRTRALGREDVQFLTWDHPLVTGALDLLLGSGAGNCCFARWLDPAQTGFYLEAVYLLECIAPPVLHVDRFLPPTPLRVLVDHRGAELPPAVVAQLSTARLKLGDPHALLRPSEQWDDLLVTLLENAAVLAGRRVNSLVAAARQEMASQLGQEMDRLRELRKINRSVRAEEIERLDGQRRALDQHLSQSRLRLDAVRLIQRGPSVA